MIFDAITRKLQAVMSSAVTTTNPTVTCTWADNTSTATTPGCTVSNLNGTTAVDIIAAPAVSTQRQTLTINIYNKDTVSQIITVRYNDNGTNYEVQKVTLGVGETLVYTAAQGWFSLDSSGNMKQSQAAIVPNSSYRVLLQSAISITAAVVAGTYILCNGEASFASASGSAFPVGLVSIKTADMPTVGSLATKLRIRGQVACNDVAPTGNFTFGLYPLTRPGTSGGAGVNIYTVGTVVSGSNGATVTTPAADSHNDLVGADFAIPADGLYAICVVTTGTIAASAHVHCNAQLQMHNA